MIIYYPCPNCKSQVSINSNVATPQDLLRQKGESFSLTCDGCHTTFMAESMRTRAKINPIKLLLGVAGSILLAVLIWDMGFITTLAVAPTYGMYHVENGNVAAYNAMSLRKWG